jgi:hypothetical protein
VGKIIVRVGVSSRKSFEAFTFRYIVHFFNAYLLISRLKTQDVLPEIGGEALVALINAINKLSVAGFGSCTLPELIELIEET